MLIDFSNIYVFAATLNIAFVAVTHTQGYTSLLANYVFGFAKNAKNVFLEKRKVVALDLNSLKTMPEVVVGEKGTTLKKKQKLVREAEKLNESIDAKEKILCTKIDELCASRKFSLYSLIMFFYSIVGMFMGAWKDDKNVIGIFYIFTICVLLGCGIIAWKNTERLIWSIGVFIFSLLLAYFFSTIEVVYSFFNDTNKLYILISACLPFMFFIIFFFMTWCKRRNIQFEMNKAFGEIDCGIRDLDTGLGILNEIKELSSEEKE